MSYITYEVMVYDDGGKYWHQNGHLHRTDGPAVEDADGSKYWYQNGQRHRTDGPAIEGTNGSKSWFQDGKRHRTDGPAVEKANGTKYWHQNDKLHRTDGPAVERVDGYKEWHIEGQELTEAEFNARTKPSFLNKERPYPTVQALLNMNDHLAKEYGHGFRTIEVNRAAFLDIVSELLPIRGAGSFYEDITASYMSRKSVNLASSGGTFTVFYKEPDQDSNPWVTTPYVWK